MNHTKTYTKTNRDDALTVPPHRTVQTFLGFPFNNDLDNLDADVAILGIPFGAPYSMEEVTNDQTNAPTAVRYASRRLQHGLDRWDYDYDGTLFDGKPIRVVDVGDVPGAPFAMGAHYLKATQAVQKILGRGVIPVTIGGDHGISIPVLRGFEARSPVTLIQLDAHLDWRDERNGVREGYSSTIRRASEMQWVDEIFQAGVRGTGSAREEEVRAAREYGTHIVTAWDIHDRGMEWVLDRIPDGGNYYLTIDADGVDPTVMPAVDGPQHGGPLYHHMRTLIHGLVRKGRVVGMDVVEIMPGRDVNEITSLAAGKFITNFIGTAVRAGYFG